MGATPGNLEGETPWEIEGRAAGEEPFDLKNS